ncbi:MAG: hypothetical protein QY326_05875 [Bdellovibrionota bacterium]|nr:MAG: hypothetical protein QY326_05875 [Bdellovibrionota bacterium]
MRYHEYVYDPAGRVQEVRLDGVVKGSYGHDLNGNRVSSNGVSATYDDQYRLLQFGDAQFEYNENGEM